MMAAHSDLALSTLPSHSNSVRGSLTMKLANMSLAPRWLAFGKWMANGPPGHRRL